MQIESWETVAPHLAGDARENELEQRIDIAELARITGIEELASKVMEAWLRFDDTTEDLTRFIEWLDLRILITNETDSRFEGLEALSDRRSYLLVSTSWSDEKRRRCLAKMLGMHILRNLSTTMRTPENLVTFAAVILQRAKANPNAVPPNESTPKYGIDSLAPALDSHFANMVHTAWCADKITRQTAVNLLRTTEKDLQTMPRIE